MKRFVTADRLFFVWISLAFVLAWTLSPAQAQPDGAARFAPAVR